MWKAEARVCPQDETDPGLFIALLLIGLLIIVGIPLSLWLFSDSCLCKQFCAKPRDSR